MKRGPKPVGREAKEARGTVQKVRDGEKKAPEGMPDGVLTGDLVSPGDMPQQPDWLTPFGVLVWQDDLPKVLSARGITELDTTLFANYCNLQGMIIQAYRANAAPPAAYLSEARKMAEIFGIGGTSSRVSAKGAPPPGATLDGGNPFARNGRRQ